MKRNRLKDAMYLIADELNDHIGWKVFLQILPAIWTTVIVQAFHSNFYTQEGNLNVWGLGIAIVTAVISAVLLVFSDLKMKKDKEAKEQQEADMDVYESEIGVRQAVTEAEISLEEDRNRILRDKINEYMVDETVQQFVSNAISPIERINNSFGELSGCFSKLSGFPRSEFTLSGAVAIVNMNAKKNWKTLDWQWLSIPTMEGTAGIDELITNDSAFSVVASGKKTFYYANDKEEATKKNEYYLDGRDSTYGSGSIVCAEIDEEIGKWRIRLIVSISTYGKMIVGKDDIKEGANLELTYEELIRDIILKQFEGELKEDLLWYGIENIDFKKGRVKKVL